MDADHSPDCPVCGGPGVELGRMGALQWYRCRNCGMDFYWRARSSARRARRIDAKTTPDQVKEPQT